MSDIYKWLRSKQTITTASGFTYEVTRLREAADEIERLEDQVAELHALLDDAHERLSEVLIGRQVEVDRLRDLGEELAEALLRTTCECPNYARCECWKQRALDAWVRRPAELSTTLQHPFPTITNTQEQGAQ